MKSKFYSLLSVLMCILALSGCEKKENVADDFKEVQGTATDAAEATNKTDVKTIDIQGVSANIYFEESEEVELGSGYKVYDADRIIMDDALLAKLASTFFDDGKFYKSFMDNQETVDGLDDQLLEEVTFDDGFTFKIAYLEGNIDNELWHLSVQQYEDEEAMGGYTIDLESDRSFGQGIPKYKADLEECNVELDLDEAILDAETFLNKFDYEDFSFASAKALVESPYGTSKEGSGYHLTFTRKIDGIACDSYQNARLILNDEDEDEIPTVIERIDFYYDESGLYFIRIEKCYVVDETSGREAKLLGIEEAEKLAQKEIEKNLAEGGALESMRDMIRADSTTGQEESEAKAVRVDIKYMPLMYGENVVFAPTYIFTMSDDDGNYGKCNYIIAAISALDGMTITPYL